MLSCADCTDCAKCADRTDRTDRTDCAGRADCANRADCADRADKAQAPFYGLLLTFNWSTEDHRRGLLCQLLSSYGFFFPVKSVETILNTQTLSACSALKAASIPVWYLTNMDNVSRFLYEKQDEC